MFFHPVDVFVGNENAVLFELFVHLKTTRSGPQV